MRAIHEIEVIGGPRDGETVRADAPRILDPEIVDHVRFHEYSLEREDDGSLFYRYRGLRDRRATVRA